MSPSDFRRREGSLIEGDREAADDAVAGYPWAPGGGGSYGDLRAHVRNQSRQLVSAGPEGGGG